MLFNSFSFLIFFPVVLLLYFGLPQKAKNVWLLAASYFFYMAWNARYGLLLLGFTLITYAASLAIERIRGQEDARNGKRTVSVIFAVSVIAILSILFYFKYFDFSVRAANKLFRLLRIQLNFSARDIALPVGISFFAFQAIGYLIDVVRGDTKAERSFFKYALFVSFFPQLVAGPIERSRNLLAQLGETHGFNFDRAKDGVFSMAWGFFLKIVVADRAAVLVDFVFANEAATGCQVAFATLVFSFQIYCDFCGYSTIALGAAKILGINLTRNFNCPYFSVSISDFWRRWHISLSTWFRDYVYIPLGGNRRSRLRRSMNIMAVMLLSGIWHGAGFNYILWGALHGVLQVAEGFGKPLIEKVNVHVRTLFTFLLVCSSWLLFRCTYISRGARMVKSIFCDFNAESVLSNTLAQYNLDRQNMLLLLFSMLLIMAADFLSCKGISLKKIVLKRRLAFQATVLVLFVDAVIVFGIWGTSFDRAAFIYFQF